MLRGRWNTWTPGCGLADPRRPERLGDADRLVLLGDEPAVGRRELGRRGPAAGVEARAVPARLGEPRVVAARPSTASRRGSALSCQRQPSSDATVGARAVADGDLELEQRAAGRRATARVCQFQTFGVVMPKKPRPSSAPSTFSPLRRSRVTSWVTYWTRDVVAREAGVEHVVGHGSAVQRDVRIGGAGDVEPRPRDRLRSSANARRTSGAGCSGAGGEARPTAGRPRLRCGAARATPASSNPGSVQPAAALVGGAPGGARRRSTGSAVGELSLRAHSAPAGLGAAGPGATLLRAAIASTFSPARGPSETSRGCRHASGSAIEVGDGLAVQVRGERVVGGDQQLSRRWRAVHRELVAEEPVAGRRRARRVPSAANHIHEAPSKSTRGLGPRAARRSSAPSSRTDRSRPVSNQVGALHDASAALGPGLHAPEVARAGAQRGPRRRRRDWRRSAPSRCPTRRRGRVSGARRLGRHEHAVGALARTVASGLQRPAQARGGRVDARAGGRRARW